MSIRILANITNSWYFQYLSVFRIKLQYAIARFMLWFRHTCIMLLGTMWWMMYSVVRMKIRSGHMRFKNIRSGRTVHAVGHVKKKIEGWFCVYMQREEEICLFKFVPVCVWFSWKEILLTYWLSVTSFAYTSYARTNGHRSMFPWTGRSLGVARTIAYMVRQAEEG